MHDNMCTTINICMHTKYEMYVYMYIYGYVCNYGRRGSVVSVKGG